MTAAIVLVVITGVYTIAGGLSAVIYTELIQTVVLIGGALTLTLLGLDEVGGFSGLQAQLPADFFSHHSTIFRGISCTQNPYCIRFKYTCIAYTE